MESVEVMERRGCGWGLLINDSNEVPSGVEMQISTYWFRDMGWYGTGVLRMVGSVVMERKKTRR